MKKLHPLLNSVCLIFLTTASSKSQILSENFNSGMPLTWNQSPASSWNHSTDLGTGGSGCFYHYQAGSASGTSNLSTPPLNLSAVTNITLNFQVASVANKFVGPDLALYYDAGAGPQFLARWGSGFNPVTTYTITYSNDYVPPLDSINVNWTPCTHTISSINGSAVKFIFEGEIVNGGYALLDDIMISGSVTTITTSLAPALQEPSFVVFPNPTLNKKVWMKGAAVKEIFIADNLGKPYAVNYSNARGEIELDLKNFSAGIYYLNALTETGELIRKKISIE